MFQKRMNTVTIFIIVEYVQKMESEFDKEKKLLKGRSWNSAHNALKIFQNLTKNIFPEKPLIITMSKIRLQQSQKWIKLKKILVASLLCFKARMTHLLILNC